MNAPSLQQLYSIEDEFEKAFLKIIEAAVKNRPSGSDFANPAVYLEFSDQEKRTPFIDIRLTDLKPDPDSSPIVAPDGREDYPRWAAILVVSYCTARGSNSDDQGEITGWLRAQTLSILASTKSDVEMPNHFVAEIMPGITPRSHDSDLGIDVSELQFAIVIEVKSGLLGI